MKKYSCSFVYQRQNKDNTVDNALRVVLLKAKNDSEALGDGLKTFDEEMKGFSLVLKGVLEIKI